MVKHTRVIGVLAVLIALSFLSGCWSRHAASSTKTVEAPAVPVPSSRKCEIDAKRICQKTRKSDAATMRPEVTKDATKPKNAGVSDHSSKHKRKARVRTETVRTEQIDISYQIPNGSVVQVQCGINPVQNSVVYAQVLPGAVLTDLDVETLLSSGYCVH